ncbi:sulfotransferase family 2 domain-containing protein [Thalassotalea psychrophila]|uniref:Sulfotransferase family 2 domain-containing protein n=1 Tax=Thalassotalea psychrophila TaxID=3065647 RepID=A0ABY9TW90_9GAMM|nr:sulfotransferase family 2 domain-containing protein [Colwelliaceae bacterium SQ149]
MFIRHAINFFNRWSPFNYRFREVATFLHLRSSIHGKQYFVSDKLKLVYVPVAKAGNTSIKQMILRAEGIPESEFNDPSNPYLVHGKKSLKHYSRKKWDNKWNEYFLFSVVREPTDRFISAHYNKFKDHSKISKQGFEFKKHLNGIFKLDMSALELIDTIKNIPNRMLNVHIVPQNFWIYKHHNCNPKIYKLEKINQLFEDLNSKGFNIEMKQENESKSKPTREIDSKLKEKVLKRYKEDYDKFNY